MSYGYIISYQTENMPHPWSGWYDTSESAASALRSIGMCGNDVTIHHCYVSDGWREVYQTLLDDTLDQRHHDAWSDAVDNWIWFLCSGGRYRCTEGFYDLSCEQRYFPIEIGAIVHEMLGAK